MEEQELLHRIDELEKKIDEMQILVRRIYKIFVWTGIITIVLFVVPLIGLVFVIPQFINYYTQIGSLSNSIP